MSTIKERRIKLVAVTHDDVLAFVNGHRGDAEYLSLPVFSELPEGYEVLGAFEAHDLHCFAFIVAHPSWPEVAPGARPMWACGSMQNRIVAYKRVDEGSET